MAHNTYPLLPCFVCQKPSNGKCSECGVAAYCSRECRDHDWNQHRNVCRPAPPQYQANPQNPAGDTVIVNHFALLFPGLNQVRNKQTEEDSIVRIIDAFRLWYIENGTEDTSGIEYLIGIGDLIDVIFGEEVEDDLQRFLKKAENTGALPIWWDKDAMKTCLEYGTWNSKKGKRLIGGTRSDINIGNKIPHDHVEKQYYGDMVEWGKVQQLAAVVSSGKKQQKGARERLQDGMENLKSKLRRY